MIKNLEINGVHLRVDVRLHRYIERKLGRLDRYISVHERESVRLSIHLKEANSSGKKECICEATLTLPKDTITIKESTLNMYAAVDIVEAKLKQQLIKHKERRNSVRHKRQLFARFRRRTAR